MEQLLIFQEALLISPQTHTIFQETLSCPQTHAISRSPLCLKHIDIFQEGNPLEADISLIGLSGCFRLCLLVVVEYIVAGLKIMFENLPIIKIKAVKKKSPPMVGRQKIFFKTKILSLSGLVCKGYLY